MHERLDQDGYDSRGIPVFALAAGGTLVDRLPRLIRYDVHGEHDREFRVALHASDTADLARHGWRRNRAIGRHGSSAAKGGGAERGLSAARREDGGVSRANLVVALGFEEDEHGEVSRLSGLGLDEPSGLQLRLQKLGMATAFQALLLRTLHEDEVIGPAPQGV